MAGIAVGFIPITWPLASRRAMAGGRVASGAVQTAVPLTMAVAWSATSLEISWVRVPWVSAPVGSAATAVWVAMAASPRRSRLANVSRVLCCGAGPVGGADTWRNR